MLSGATITLISLDREQQASPVFDMLTGAAVALIYLDKEQQTRMHRM